MSYYGTLLLLLSLLRSTSVVRAQQQACTYDEVLVDTCPSRVDLVCDVGRDDGCPAGSDCFDCDPCRRCVGPNGG